jgi:predicted TIM-barrel fold metal-dependent hydrolase
MSSRATDDTVSSLDDLPVIYDADAHISEEIEDLLPYIRNEGIRDIIASASNPLHDIYSMAHALPSDYHSDRGAWKGEHARGVEQKLKEMNEFGLDYGLMDPSLNLALPTVNNSRFAVALAEAYNSWILDSFLNETDRLKATLIVPPQKPEKGAEEINRVGDEDGIVGVMIPSSGTVPPLGHSWYDPIYEAAAKKGLPVVLHGAATSSSEAFPVQYYWNETYAEDHAIIHPFSQIWNLTSMIIQGIPERYPDMDFVFQEAGIGWIPYMMWRLDDHYLELSHEMAALEKLPSKYIREQFYFTTQPIGHTAADPTHLSKMIELAGPDSIMYASDLPHTDFDPPEELFNRISSQLSGEEVRGIMGETAAEVFDLGG